MRFARLTAFAAIAASLAGVSTTLADTLRLSDAPPPIIRGPVTTIPFPLLACAMAPGHSYPYEWRIQVVNNLAGQYTVPQGTQIQWNTLNGLSGVATVGSGGIPPGGVFTVGISPTPWSCFASVAS